MANPSNLYAEKIFAEHPSALFTLDDDADYLSIIPSANRDLNTWTKSGVTSVTEIGINSTPARPADEFTVYRALLPEPASTVSNPDATGTLSLGTFDIPDGGFSAGLYVYFTNPYFKTITFTVAGTSYTSSTTLNYSDMGKWIFISKTITTPALFGATINIEIGYGKNTAGTDIYEIYLAGITAGKYADEYNASSFGGASKIFSAATTATSGTGTTATIGIVRIPVAILIIKANGCLAKLKLTCYAVTSSAN